MKLSLSDKMENTEKQINIFDFFNKSRSSDRNSADYVDKNKITKNTDRCDALLKYSVAKEINQMDNSFVN